MSEANKHVVRRFVEDVINRGRYDALEEIYTPETAAAARAWIAPFREAFPDVRMDVVELVAEGDKVAARFTCSATQRGRWQGHPAAGRRFERVAEVTFFTFREGRIAATWGLEDNLDRMQQLGVVPGRTINAGGPESAESPTEPPSSDEHAPAPEHVAEAAAGDEEYHVGELIAGRDHSNSPPDAPRAARIAGPPR